MTEPGDRRRRWKRRIVVIGSMSVYSEMLDAAAALAAADIPTVVPEVEGEIVRQLSLPDFEVFKRRVSLAYLKKIRDPQTYCVFAMNLDRHGILDYVGPNTFAEIAVAFAQSKRIYLYQGIPEAYSDELSAWRSVALHGKMDRMISEFREFCVEESMQLPLLE